MRADRVISTIDFHTAGIGMRLVTSGLGRIPGATIGEKRRWFQEHLDHVRTGLCLEPRGHRSLLIAIMTEPVTPGAQFGLFFIYPGGYYVSCGEGTIGAATIAVETGMVAQTGSETPVVIDTEAGAVETVARSAGGRVREVTLRWTPSFVVLPAQTVEVEGVGEVPLDISVGVGNVFAIVEASRVGVSIKRELAKRIAQRGMAVRDAVNAQLQVTVPGLGKTSVDNVLVHELPDGAGVSLNALVWGPGQVALGLAAPGGNAGLIAPGHSFAWAAPRAPRMLLDSLRGAETAIRVRLAPDLGLYTWGLRFLRECTADRARRNTLIKLRLCQYSQAVMNELVGRESIEYHAIARGALYLYRDHAELEAGTKKIALLAEHGQKQEILDARAVARLDPVFEPVRDKIAGAIRDVC